MAVDQRHMWLQIPQHPIQMQFQRSHTRHISSLSLWLLKTQCIRFRVSTAYLQQRTAPSVLRSNLVGPLEDVHLLIVAHWKRLDRRAHSGQHGPMLVRYRRNLQIYLDDAQVVAELSAQFGAAVIPKMVALGVARGCSRRESLFVALLLEGFLGEEDVVEDVVDVALLLLLAVGCERLGGHSREVSALMCDLWSLWAAQR